MHVGLTNVDPNEPHDVSVKLDGLNGRSVQGRILTAAQMDAHNSFDEPNHIVPVAFDGARLSGNALTVMLPAKSIVMLDIR